MKLRTITIPKGYTIEKALEDAKKLFKVWTYTDDFSGVVSDRNPDEEYSISFKDSVEPDLEYRKKSANEIKDVEGITLLERLVLEIDYFKETGKHLDIKGWTICSGSRRSGGCVPSVGWDLGRGGVRIRWDGAGASYDGSGARAAVRVSLAPLTSDTLTLAIKTVKKAGYIIYKQI